MCLKRRPSAEPRKPESMWRVVRRTAATLQPAGICRLPPPSALRPSVPLARAFSAPSRVTDASRQPGLAPNKPRGSLDVPSATPSYPIVTAEQREAREAKKAAYQALTEAKQAASGAAVAAKVLKKVADDAAAARTEADAAVAAAAKKVHDADNAVLKADLNSVEVTATAAEKEKRFLSNAFDYFDIDETGNLTPEHIRFVLETLKMPAMLGDVEDLVEVLDDSKDNLIQKEEWVKYMPPEMKMSLRNSKHASKWV